MAMLIGDSNSQGIFKGNVQEAEFNMVFNINSKKSERVLLSVFKSYGDGKAERKISNQIIRLQENRPEGNQTISETPFKYKLYNIFMKHKFILTYLPTHTYPLILI